MSDAGKIAAGLVLFGAVVTGPIWYGLGRGKGAPPDLEKPAGEKQCIEPTSFMRARHMELLDRWRDAVVRRDEHVYVASDGKRHEMSLTGTCLRCHSDTDKFCIRCHQYAGVEAFCWDCHQQKGRTASATAAADAQPGAPAAGIAASQGGARP
ncbi:MAG TPA: sulfate reduction electron transfer complex DsrMKJOP subunit DsrJ [Anaeromyxobacter sp.]